MQLQRRGLGSFHDSVVLVLRACQRLLALRDICEFQLEKLTGGSQKLVVGLAYRDTPVLIFRSTSPNQVFLNGEVADRDIFVPN
jgi:hypothetical protein